jgi:hypothetical protein
MNEEKATRNRGRWVYIALILLLLALNGWLFYNNSLNTKDREQKARQIEEAGILYNQLEAKYSEAQTELEMQKGQFVQKDSLIASLEGELNAKREEIDRLLKTCNFFNGSTTTNEKKLDEVKEEIEALEVDCSTFKAQLDEMNVKYAALLEDFNELTELYDREVERTEEAIFERDSIAIIGGAILAKELDITGVKKRKSGTDVTGMNAKKAEQLRVCFDVMPNKLSAGKKQTFYVKIISPSGKILFSPENGSGEFINREDPDDVLYSKAITVDYDGEFDPKGEPENYCTYWEQETDFRPGAYTIKVYHNGYLASRSSFTLKKSVLDDLVQSVQE